MEPVAVEVEPVVLETEPVATQSQRPDSRLLEVLRRRGGMALILIHKSVVLGTQIHRTLIPPYKPPKY